MWRTITVVPNRKLLLSLYPEEFMERVSVELVIKTLRGIKEHGKEPLTSLFIFSTEVSDWETTVMLLAFENLNEFMDYYGLIFKERPTQHEISGNLQE